MFRGRESSNCFGRVCGESTHDDWHGDLDANQIVKRDEAGKVASSMKLGLVIQGVNVCSDDKVQQSTADLGYRLNETIEVDHRAYDFQIPFYRRRLMHPMPLKRFEPCSHGQHVAE